MLEDFNPALSDLIKDWAEEGKWPITIKPSTQHPGIWWVESEAIMPPMPGSGMAKGSPVYIGSIHDDTAMFKPTPSYPNEDLRAEDPEFFQKLAGAIQYSLDQYKQHIGKIDLSNG